MAAYDVYKDGTFVDLGGQTWTVEVRDIGGVGDQGTLEFDARPLTINAIDDRPSLPWGIIRTSCELRTIGEDSLFDTVRDAGYRDYKILTSSNSGTFGTYNFWADTRGMRQKISKNSYNVLRGTDGIDHLRGAAWYDDVDAAYADGVGSTPRKSVVVILADILKKTGWSNGIDIAFDWFPNTTGMTTAARRSLEYVDIDLAWLYLKLLEANGGSDNDRRFVSAYDALDHILQRFHLKLTQVAGRWYLFQRPYYSGDFARYDSDGVYASKPSTSRIDVFDESTPYHTLRGNEYHIFSGTSYEVAQGVFDYDSVGSLLDDPTFQSINSAADKRWTANGGITAGVRDNERRTLYIDGAVGNPSTDTFTAAQCVSVISPSAYNVRSNWSMATLEAQNTNYIELKATARYLFLEAYRSNVDPYHPHFAMLSIEASSTGGLVTQESPAEQMYLQDAQDGNGIYNEWGSGKTLIPVEIGYYGNEVIIKIKAQTNTAYLTAGNDYQFRVALYKAVDTGYGVNSSTFQVGGMEWVWPAFEYFQNDAAEGSDLVSTWTNDEDVGHEPLTDVVWYVGDGPHDGARSALMHTSAGEYTGNWNKGSVGAGDNLDTLWMDQLFAQFASAPKGVTLDFTLVNAGTPATNQIPLAHFLEFGGTTYCPTRVSWHPKRTEYSWEGLAVQTAGASVSSVQLEGNYRQGRWHNEMPSNEGPECWFSVGPTFTDTGADITASNMWFKANARCKSITYLITTSSTWSIAGGTTIAVGKGQAKATDETGLDFTTVYYIHYQAYTQSGGSGISGAELSETFTTPESKLEILDQMCICRDAGSVSGASVTLSLGDGGDDIALRENVYADEPLMFVPQSDTSVKHWITVDADALQDGTSVDITFTGGSQTYATGGYVLSYSRTLAWLRKRLQGESSAGKVPPGYSTADLIAWYGFVEPLDSDLILDSWYKDGKLNNASIDGMDMTYILAGLQSVDANAIIYLDSDLAPTGPMVATFLVRQDATVYDYLYRASWDSGAYSADLLLYESVGRVYLSGNANGVAYSIATSAASFSKDEFNFISFGLDWANTTAWLSIYNASGGTDYVLKTNLTAGTPSAVDANYPRLDSFQWTLAQMAVHSTRISTNDFIRRMWFLRQAASVGHWAKSTHGIDMSLAEYGGDDEPSGNDLGPPIGHTSKLFKGANTTCPIDAPGLLRPVETGLMIVYVPDGTDVPQQYKTTVTTAHPKGHTTLDFASKAMYGPSGWFYIAAQSLYEEQKEWSADLVFSATDADTIAWTSGTIYLESGKTYAIVAGNTGNMLATTWIYLDPSVSATVLEKSTTFSAATGQGKVIIAIATPSGVAGVDAAVVVRRGFGIIKQSMIPDGIIDTVHIALAAIEEDLIKAAAITTTKISDGAIETPKLAAGAITAVKIAAGTITANEITAGTITAAEIAAGTITANEITAGTITATELNVATLSAITANVGTLTSGTINGVTAYFGSGQEVTCDSNGISIATAASYAIESAITFMQSTNVRAYTFYNHTSNEYIVSSLEDSSTLVLANTGSSGDISIGAPYGDVTITVGGSGNLGLSGIDEATPSDTDELLWLSGNNVRQVNVDALPFLRSDEADTANGVITFEDWILLDVNSSRPATVATGYAALYVYNNGGTHQLEVMWQDESRDVLASFTPP